MSGSNKIFLLLGIFLFAISGENNAQSLKEVFFDSPGLQIGMHQGQTDFNDQGLNYQFRIYNRYTFDSGRFGEISLSSGIVSGLGYRSQLTPLDYRVGQPLTAMGIPPLNLFNRKSPLYAYAGLGVFYNRPLEVVAPDDPLTREMGSGLPTTSFWDFKGGFAPFIPVGLGLEIPLELGARLDISAGYNQTLRSLKFNHNDVPKGFWGVSVGINFWKPKPDFNPQPLYAPVITEYPAVAVEAALLEPTNVEATDLSEILLRGLNRKSINFDVLSSNIQTEDREWLSKASMIIDMNPGAQIHIKGHADATGEAQVNDMISESRARAVWLALAEYGIETPRIEYSWYAANDPVSNNETEEGRFRNRRVEFDIQAIADGVSSPISKPNTANGADVEINEPIAAGAELNFDWLELTGETPEQTFLMVTELLNNRPDLHVYVASVSNESWASQRLQQEFEKARSDKVKAMLTELGVNPIRILNYNPYEADFPEQYRQYLESGLDQQTLIIPFIPSENEE